MILIDDRVTFGEWVELGALNDLDALPDDEAAVRLATLLSAVSERNYCAGWLTGLEREGWAWGESAPGTSVTYGFGCVEEPILEAVRRARVRLGGAWVGFHRGLGVVFLTAEEWDGGRWPEGWAP